MVEIRMAAREDLATIHNMADVVFRETYRTILSPEQMDYMMDWMYSLTSLERQLQEGHVYYIAWDGDKPQGYVSVQKEREGLYHLQKIYVMPSAQKTGLGRLLMERALKHVKDEAGHAAVELNVNRENPALGFYKHVGFKIVRQGDFPIGRGFYMNDYIMGIEV